MEPTSFGDPYLVGPLREERSGHLTPRIDGITGMHGRTHQRTLDQALQELLAEWEQH